MLLGTKKTYILFKLKSVRVSINVFSARSKSSNTFNRIAHLKIKTSSEIFEAIDFNHGAQKKKEEKVKTKENYLNSINSTKYNFQKGLNLLKHKSSLPAWKMSPPVLTCEIVLSL